MAILNSILVVSLLLVFVSPAYAKDERRGANIWEKTKDVLSETPGFVKDVTTGIIKGILTGEAFKKQNEPLKCAKPPPPRYRKFPQDHKLPQDNRWIYEKIDGTTSPKKEGAYVVYSKRLKTEYHEGRYAKDQRTGVWRTYRNGRIMESCQYKDNMKNGKCNSFDLCLNVLGVTSYLDNQLHGEFLRKRPTGKLEMEGQYQRGRKIGLWHYYDKSGREETTKNHDPIGPKSSDRLITLRVFSKGNKRHHEYIENGWHITKKWYYTGNPELESRQRLAEMGPFYKKTWYRNKNPESEISYDKNTDTLSKAYWYRNGQRMLLVKLDSKGTLTEEVLYWENDGKPISKKEWSKRGDVRDENIKKVLKALELPASVIVYGLK